MPDFYWYGLMASGIAASLMMDRRCGPFERITVSVFVAFALNWGFFIIALGNLWLYRDWNKEDHAVVNAMTDGF